jgi:hypothetical protein
MPLPRPRAILFQAAKKTASNVPIPNRGPRQTPRLGQFPYWCIPEFPRECHGDRSEAEWSHPLFFSIKEQKVARLRSP